MKIYHKQIIHMIILLALIVSACSLAQSSNPISEAKKLFEEWALQAGVPYKNALYEVITNDGAFATVRVTVNLRTSATENWLEKQADVDCRHIGSEWQCNSAFVFSLTEAEQSRQNQIVSATATASAIKLQATASEMGRQAEATQEAIKKTQVVIELNSKATATAMSFAATETALVPPPPVAKYIREVSALNGWHNTCINISVGDTLQISQISGSWTIFKGSDPYTDGNGQEGRRDSCTLMPDHNTGGLIGQIGDNTPFWVGNDVTLRQIQLSGALKLSIDDCPPFEGNDGSLTVDISVAKP